MAELPTYGGGIAPPISTGEILDTQSPQLAQARAEAIGRVGQSAAGAVSAAGSLFEKISALNQQSTLTEALDGYRAEQQKILQMIDATPSAVGSWAPDESGNRGDLLEMWHQNQVGKYGEGLRGRFADEFAHQTNGMILEMEAGIGEFALVRQRDDIAARDLAFMSDVLNNPDTTNPERWVNRTMATIENRYRMGINSGVYTRFQAAEGVLAARAQATQGVYQAITADIQDSDGWNHPVTPRVDEQGVPSPYIGLNGALDFISDSEESGVLSNAMANQMRAVVDEQDRIRASRGADVQRQQSLEYTQDWQRRILVDGERPTMRSLLSDPRINSEITDNYYRNGDASASRYITGLLDDALNPTVPKTQWDWAEVSRYGGSDFYELFHDSSLDNIDFQARLLSLSQNHRLPPDGQQWIFDKSRDAINNDNYIFARKEVEGFYSDLLGADRFKDGKNEEERLQLEGQMMRDVGGILEAIGDPDIATRADINDVITNFKTRKIGETIFQEFTREDPRKLNAAEQILLDMEMGGYRGLTYIPRFAEEAAKVGELHRQMTAEIYGEENILQMMWGEKGTQEEGRVAFLVSDQTADGAQRWVQYRIEGNEEVPWEFDPATYDDKVGEVWAPARAPVLLRMEAESEEAATTAEATIQDAVKFGSSYDELRAAGYTPEVISEALGGDTTRLPGSPDYIGDIPRAADFFLQNASNGEIPLTSITQFGFANNFSPDQMNQFFEYIWAQNRDKLAEYLRTQENNGEINLVNNRGGRREIANGVLRRRISAYGLPREYMDRVFEYTFGATE